MVSQVDKSAHLWKAYADKEQLTAEQLALFQQYATLLQEWNRKFNITRVDEEGAIVTRHFEDALAVGHLFPLKTVSSVADIGTGGGIPGIPLAIKYPHLAVTLIEVNGKKISFLQEVIQQLGLTNVTIAGVDWRTFLKKASRPIDLFVARASLHTDELVRMFKPDCPYNNAVLIYFGSEHWEPTKADKPFLYDQKSYMQGSKKRRLLFFKRELL